MRTCCARSWPPACNRICRETHTPLNRGTLLPADELLRIFMSYGAHQSTVVSASACLWPIVDRRWRRRREVSFLQLRRKGKAMTNLQGAPVATVARWGVFWGSSRKNCTRMARMKVAPATVPSYVLRSTSIALPTGRDAPPEPRKLIMGCARPQIIGEIQE